MRNTLKRLAGVAMLVTMLSACNSSNDSPYIISIPYMSSDLTMGYGAVSSQNLTMTTAPQIILSRNLTDETLQFTLNSLYTPSGVISCKSDELKYTTTSLDEKGRLLISLGAVDFGNYTFTDFNFLGYGNWMSLQFTYNGLQYVINSAATYSDPDLQVNIILWDAETLVTGTPFDPEGFETSNTRYAFSLNSALGTGSVIIYDAQFASMMPELEILIPGVNFEMTNTGYRVWSESDIIPQSVTLGGGVPQPSYVIKNFNAFLPYNTVGGSLEFNCSENDWLVQGENMTITVLTSANQL